MRHETVQLKISVTPAQKQAVLDTARKLDVTQGTLVRDAIYLVTHEPNVIERHRFSERKQGNHRGWAARELK